MRADYEAQLDARHAAARGQVDAIITPEETRELLAFALRICANYAGPHLGHVRLGVELVGLGEPQSGQLADPPGHRRLARAGHAHHHDVPGGRPLTSHGRCRP